MKKIILCGLLLLLHIASANPVRLSHTEASLKSAYQVTDGNSEILLLLHLKIDPHWHTYWKNPGDSGLATQIKLNLPAGFSVGDMIWQVPHRIAVGHLTNYGYEDNAYHLIQITPPAEGYRKQNLSIKAKADWLVCQEECIPEQAEFELSLPIQNQNIESADHDLIYTLLSRSVSRLPTINGTFSGTSPFTVAIDRADLSNAKRVESMYFFVDENGLTNPAAPQPFARQDQTLTLNLQPGDATAKPNMHGVLEVTDKMGNEYYQLSVHNPALSAPPINSNNSWGTIGLMMVFALLGGLILNAMPCVFPVLSIKIIHLIKSTEHQRHNIYRFGLSYALGVLVSFAMLALILISLKQAGAHVGWGYQMQSPIFVAVLTYLLFLVGLNLSGYFDVSLTADFGHQTASREDMLGNFVTGCLVTLVATPCTAPFMGVAIGSALTQPAWVAMLIFLSLGLGLALPFVLFTLLPGAHKCLPKPGVWMVRLKELLAFPMFASVIWLLWVFMHQMPNNATGVLLLGLLMMTFFIWLFQQIKPSQRLPRLLLFFTFAAMSLSPLWYFQHAVEPPATGVAKFNQATLEHRVAAGDKLFVYATAAWCITCQVNEQVALASSSVKQAFTEQGIDVIALDWTNHDPDIAAFLSRFGRSGVPLYLYYPGNNQPPVILPQLLTPQIVLNYITQPTVKESS